MILHRAQVVSGCRMKHVLLRKAVEHEGATSVADHHICLRRHQQSKRKMTFCPKADVAMKMKNGQESKGGKENSTVRTSHNFEPSNSIHIVKIGAASLVDSSPSVSSVPRGSHKE